MTAPIGVPTVPVLGRWDRIELAHAGTWHIQVGGQQTFTPDDFAAAVAALDCPAVGRPVIKLGHLDDRGTGMIRPGIENRDGEPALGWVTNMGLANNHQTLIADLVGMPGWLGQIAASAYPSRSIEGARNFTCQLGHRHPFVISAVALLGLTPPGVGTVGSLQDHVRALYGVAASESDLSAAGEPFAVTTFTAAKEAPVPKRPELVAAAVTVEELRTAFHTQSPWDYWITEIQLDPLQLIVTSDGNGETYRVPVTVGADGDSFTFGQPVAVEVTYVDTNEAAETVAASAGPQPLSVKFATRAESRPGEQPMAAAGEPAVPPAPEAVAPQSPAPPVTPSTPGAPVAPVFPAAEPVPTTETEGGADVSLSEFRSRLGLDETADEAAVLAAFDEQITKANRPAEPAPELVAAAAQQEARFAAALGRIDSLSTELSQIKAEKAADNKRAFFAAAVQQGKIAPAERETWEADYDKSPEVVTRIIGAIKAGTAVPVAASGYVGDPEPRLTDDDLLMLLPPEQRELAGKDA